MRGAPRLTHADALIPDRDGVFAHPQRQASALNERGVILAPVAQAVGPSSSLVFHTSTLPAPRLRDYLCNEAIWKQNSAGARTCRILVDRLATRAATRLRSRRDNRDSAKRF